MQTLCLAWVYAFHLKGSFINIYVNTKIFISKLKFTRTWSAIETFKVFSIAVDYATVETLSNVILLKTNLNIVGDLANW